MFSRAVGREGGCKQITLARARGVSATLGLPPLTAHTAQALGCSVGNRPRPALGCMPSSRLEGRTSWIFSTCSRCSRLTTGTSGTGSGGLRKGQAPCEWLGGLSGFLSLRCGGLRPCVESVPEPEDSSPVPTWILGYFWSLTRAVSSRLEWGPARALSPRPVAAVSRFP